MTRHPALYLFTASYAVLILGYGLLMLLGALAPTPDIKSRSMVYQAEHQISDIPPGEIKTVVELGQRIFIWHRNDADLKLVRAQDDPALWPAPFVNSPLYPRGTLAYDSVLAQNPRWLVVWGTCDTWGYTAMTRAGDHGGFFCIHYATHHDLSGRVLNGGSSRSLQPIPYTLSEDGQTITLDLRYPPRIRR